MFQIKNSEWFAPHAAAYYRQPVNELKVNLYFGNAQFVAVARRIVIPALPLRVAIGVHSIVRHRHLA
ncbi:MAG: hypothetical protein WB822_02260 [Rhodoplanes sp.]